MHVSGFLKSGVKVKMPKIEDKGGQIHIYPPFFTFY